MSRRRGNLYYNPYGRARVRRRNRYVQARDRGAVADALQPHAVGDHANHVGQHLIYNHNNDNVDIMANSDDEDFANVAENFDVDIMNNSDDEHFIDIPNHIAQQSLQDPAFLNLRQTFLDKISAVHQFVCDICHEKSFVAEHENANTCKRCRNNPRKFSDENNVNPGQIPPQLIGLTPVEKLLIAQVNPSMVIHRLARGGQFGLHGHVLNVPQDINRFVINLPRTVDDLDILVLKKANNNVELPPTFFTVNRQRVLNALTWLKENNIYYRHIVIVNENVAALPVDGLININDNHILNEPANNVPNVNGVNPVVNGNNGENNQRPPAHTFIPQQITTAEERAAIQAAVNNGEVVDWPVAHNNPINEFNTVGYIARAFPCLFPTGAADLRAARETEITASDYFKHMLHYHDGRFESDPRFVFIAYNSLLRWQALQVGNVYVRNNPNARALTAQDVQQLLDGDRTQLAQQVLRFGKSIRGTPQYWYTRRQELLAMIQQLGSASLFFTFSVADHQWPDLRQFLSNDYQNTAEAIAHSPLTVDSYVQLRFEIFFENFLKPYLSITDFWYRVEWQHRGSLHIHGLAWMADIPDSNVCAEQEVVTFWNKYVNSFNPAIGPQDNPVEFFWPVQRHPCSIPMRDIHNLNDDLKDLVNICQKHTRCTPGYCLRTMPDGQQKCRFGFPKEIRNETTATFTLDAQGNRKKLEISPATNDPFVNRYNSHCLSVWRANMDFNITFDMTDVSRYIAKYTSKGEKSTTDFSAILNAIVHNEIPPDAGLGRIAGRLLLKTVGNMDVSAQQAVHVVSSLPLFRCSKQIVNLIVDGRAIQDNLNTRYGASEIRKYMRRPQLQDELSFLQTVKLFTITERRRDQAIILTQRRSGPAIVVIAPKYKPNPAHPTFNNYCMQYLLLHKPFRAWDDVTHGFPDVVAAYNHFVQLQGNADEHFNHLNFQIEQAAQEIAEEEEIQPPPHHADDWMALVNANPPPDMPVVPNADFDWQAASAPFFNAIPRAIAFLQESIEAAGGNVDAQYLPNNQPDPINLNAEQRSAYQHIEQHMQQANLPPLRVLILGSAGTGKSYLIHCIKRLLGNRCAVLAPTGVAALNINGSTVHSFLRFCKLSNLQPLRGPSLQQLQNTCQDISCIIIDEVSMIGCHLLNAVDQRLRQAFPLRADEFFGGVSVILLGDLGQLPPVLDSRLFHPTAANERSLLGSAAYHQFNTVFKLIQSVRQAHDEQFSNLLIRLRDARCTIDDYNLLSDRFQGTVPDLHLFDSAIRLFPKKVTVAEHNHASLLNLRQPIAVVESAHNCPAARDADSNTACGLSRHLSLAVGAKVMLRSNLWVAKGLVNGTLGVVRHIVFNINEAPPSLPAVVICEFPQYTGPSFFPDRPHHFPVVPVRRTWLHGNVLCCRTGLPLSLSYALTVHKCQGLTLPKVVVDIGNNELAAGISFVALSRVRSFQDIVLAPFPAERLLRLSNNENINQRKQEELRLNQFVRQ